MRSSSWLTRRGEMEQTSKITVKETKGEKKEASIEERRREAEDGSDCRHYFMPT